MTSLAKQLQRLAVPHTQTVLGEDRSRASLLFDPKEAASVDRETYHALGLNGIEELETINPLFHEFIGSLFADSALTFERSVQTKEVNEKLDATIKRFLIHLSPYCLLKPAHKALEWLIHRYHIHQYNVDDLLMCFLPYHESKIFIRVLQLLKFDSKIASKWDWLQPLQKAGIHLSRMTLVNHCRTNQAFLNFICNMIPATVKAHQESNSNTPNCRVLFSFYATTVISVIDSGSIKEEFVAVILPHLSRGMKSSLTEYKAASYMILAQLLHSAKLKPEILKTLIAKSLCPELLSEGLACLLLMFQNQDMSNVKLSKRSFKSFCKHFSVVDTLAKLAEQFDVSEFLTCFLDKLVPAAFKMAVGMATSGESGASSASESDGNPQQYMSMLHRLLLNMKLTDILAEQVASKFLELYVQEGSKFSDEEVDGHIKDSLQGIMRQLEGRYSCSVDSAVQKMMSQSSKQEQDFIKNFLNEYVLSVPHQLIADTGSGLVLSLNHRLPEVRQTAVEMLIQNRDEVEDGEFFHDSVLARLNDDDPKVVKAVLQLGQEVWSVIGDDMITIPKLVNIISRGLANEHWKSVATAAAKILGDYDGERSQELLTSLLSIFFVTKKSLFQFEVIQDLLASKMMMASSVFTKKFAEELKSLAVASGNVDLGEVNYSICRSFAVALLSLSLEEGINMVSGWIKEVVDTSNFEISCLLMITLDCLVTMVKDSTTRLRYSLLLIGLTSKLMKQSHTFKKRKTLHLINGSWQKLILEKADVVAKQILPTSFCTKVLNTLVDVLMIPAELKGKVNWQVKGDNSCEDMFLQLYVAVYGILLEKASAKNKHVIVFRSLMILFEKKFIDGPSYLKFHCLLWTQHANDRAIDLHLTPVIQARSLKLGQAVIHNMTEETIKPAMETISVNLLITLTSQHSPVRGLAVDIARELLSKVEGQDCVFQPLLKKVVHCSEELCADPNFVQQLIASIFKHTAMNDDVSPRKSPSKTKKRKSGEHKPLDSKAECLKVLIDWINNQSTPLYIYKQLLDIFSLLNNKELLISLLPLMERLLNQDHDSQSKMAAECLTTLLQRFTVETKDVLESSSQGLELFIKALKLPGMTGGEACLPQKQAVNQITKELYSALEPASQQIILSCLFDVCLGTDDLEIANMIRRCLKHLPVDGAHVEVELKACLKAETANTVREAKRLKQTVGETAAEEREDEFSRRDWQKAIVVLETVQNKKKILNYTVLVPVCFQLIARILESDNHSEAEYIKQTILTLLYNICGKMQKDWEDTKDAVVPERQFNMELIVNCIRSSENPQTHHHALLVLTAAAKIYPEHLLHNMMSVFTFMGANIMRQDDAYSFHIISRILETVIPALITACEQRKKVPKGITNDLDDIITMVIQVFVDSYSHIPEHRRPLLFSKLLTVIGQEKFLWRMLSLMMGLVVTKGTLKAELSADPQEGDPGIRDVEFCLGLCSQVPVSVQLISARKMIEYQLSLPDEKEEEGSQKRKPLPKSLGKLMKEDVAIFNVDSHSAKQLRHFKYATVHLLVSLFSNQDFIVQMSENEDERMLEHFQALLETLLQFISHITSVVNTSSDKSTAKFWKALHHKVHDLLDKLVSLLPDQSFVDVIGGLVSHDLPSIQRKAIELLNTKLQQQKEITTGDGSELLSLVSQLQELITTQTMGTEITEEGSINSQAAFISLKLLCRYIGQRHTDNFVKVLRTAVGVFTGRHGNIQVSSCALLCIAEVCNTLKVHVIQHLSSFMPALMKVMADHDQLLQNELYVLSVVTTVNKVVENLSHFLSPYLQDIMLHVCVLSSSTDDIIQKPQVQLRLKTIRTTLSTALPTRVLLPTVTTCYGKLVTENMDAITCLMALFGDHIAHIGREDLLSHINQLQTFFLICLNVRIDYPEESSSVIAKLEGVTIETIISMVLKLSEATFKPFLYKIFDWATSDDDYRERILVFYRLADSLAEKLRSLFSLFAGHIISHAAKMLDENNISKTKSKFFSIDKKHRKQSCLMLQYILDCLYKTFLYDTEGFVNKERFDTIMQPLVDQIENIQGSEEMYVERVDQHLVRCIVQLTVASQDDSLWRSINYQICLKTRSSEPQIRESALKVLDELHKRLGEDYMPLLPDTVPFLAELMEDESEEVEKKCQAVIREMEKTLGEPLQKYF